MATGLYGALELRCRWWDEQESPIPVSDLRRGGEQGVGQGDFLLNSGNWSSCVCQGYYLCARDAG